MHVQTTTARINNFHRATPFHRAALDASKKRKSPTRALRNFRRLLFVVLPSVPAILVRGLYSARVGRPLSPRGCTNATSRAHFHPSLWAQMGVAVGMSVARHPPRRSVRALVSAHGSYLGCEWRQSAIADTDEGCAVPESTARRDGRSATSSAGACRSGGATTTASD